MIPALRKSFNERWTDAQFRDLVARLELRTGATLGFPISETPCFLPRSWMASLGATGLELIDQILGNKEAKANISVEDNAKAIDPGFDMMSPAQQNDIKKEVEEALKLWPTHGDGKWKSKLMLKDSIADVTLQFVLIRPKDYDVIATMKLNGDYLSDALAAQVGGIGIAPGANINYDSGHAVFEATHGTAPKYADLDKVNPGSVILSGEMMLRYMGWSEAADLIIKGIEGAVNAKTVTYDFERLMPGAKLVSCSGFGDAIIANM